MKKSSIAFITCSVIMSGLLLLVSCAPEAAPSPVPAEKPVYEWRLACHMKPGQPHYDLGLATMLPRVIEERTNGRIKITTYPEGALVPVPDMLSALGEGTIDMVVTAPSYWKGFMPVANIEGGLPAMWRDPYDSYTVFWERGLEEQVLIPAYAEHNVRYLTIMPGSFITLFTTEPITKTADFKGKKLRGFGGFLDLLDNLEAASTYIPHGEIYTALALGTVEGAMSSPLAYYGLKLYEQVDYIVQPNFSGCYNDQMLINLDVWNSLDAELQQTLIAAAREVSWNYARLQVAEEQKALRGFQEQGVEIVVVEDWDEKVVPIAVQMWSEAAQADAYSTTAYNILLDYYREVGLIK